MKRALIILSLAFTVGYAQPAAQVERSISTQPPQVETRSYEQNGKAITERVTTTRVKEIEAVSYPKNYKAAIFIANRAGNKLEEKMLALEDLITARVTEGGFQVISREVAADAVRTFDPTLANSPRPADSLDTKLSNQSSALRLAQGLGADYLLVAAIDSLGTKERAVNAYGVNAITTDTTMRITYKIIDGSTGASIAADAVKVTSSSRQTENAVEKNTDVINDLLDQAAQQIGDSLKNRVAQNRVAAPAGPAEFVAFTIKPEAADLMIPDVRIGPDNTISISEGKYKVNPLSVTVEIDGIAVGTAPGTLKVRPGFSKLRLTREGFQPWERTINAVNGQTLAVAMTLSPEGYARWQQSTAFVNGLKNGAKLTDAQVKVLEGQAKAFEQSGYKVDIKVDTKEGITVKNTSLFGN